MNTQASVKAEIDRLLRTGGRPLNREEVRQLADLLSQYKAARS